MRLREFHLPKNSWQLIVSDSDKEEIGHDLVQLVQTAYSSTIKGSFVNSLKDVLPSDWLVFDWDNEPGADAAIFYRKSRPSETWTGFKIQGIGHDGKAESKQRAIAKVHQLITQPGWWIETSHAMRLAMMKMNAPAVTDEALISGLFPRSFIRMIDKKTYIRKVESGLIITETTFGHPILKNRNTNESINPQVFRRGFEQTKKVLGGKYMLKAYHGLLPYSPTKKINHSENFHIDAFTANGNKVGNVTYKVTDNNLEAVFVEVKPEFRRQGIAKEMYIFAKELGNDIIPSSMRIYNGNDFGKGIADLYSKGSTDKEALSEIDYCHEVGDLVVDDANIIFWAESAGFSDDTEVFKFDADSQQMYFLKDNEKISAYVIVSDGRLRGIRNISKFPGQIMVIMLFIIRTLGQKLTISKDEKLSDDGFNWLCAVIKAGGYGLTVTDQTGQLPNINVLRKEWEDANTGPAGPSEIFLEGQKQDIIRENKHPLMPKYKWLGRKGIL